MKMFLTLATVLVALGLAACGGGGGGGSPSPSSIPATSPVPTPAVDTTKPVLTLMTSSPASPTTTIVFSSNEDLNGNVLMLVKYGDAAVSGTTTLNRDTRGMTWAPLRKMPCGAVLNPVATGTDLSGNTEISSTGSVTIAPCSPASWWPPATITSFDQKVSPGLLSGENILIGDEAWQAAVQNGTVKFVDSDDSMASFDPRPFVWAVHQYDGAWCAIAVHKNDGSHIGRWTSAKATCNSEPFDYAVSVKATPTAPAGLIRHSVNRNQCFKLQWSASAGTFTDTLTACPQ